MRKDDGKKMLSYIGCENCGERMYGGYCTWCHEEVFIAEQYERDGEIVPDVIYEKLLEFENQRKNRC